MELVNTSEKATAMKADVQKTATMPLGTTRWKQVPTALMEELNSPGPSQEPYEIYLGAPNASEPNMFSDLRH